MAFLSTITVSDFLVRMTKYLLFVNASNKGVKRSPFSGPVTRNTWTETLVQEEGGGQQPPVGDHEILGAPGMKIPQSPGGWRALNGVVKSGGVSASIGYGLGPSATESAWGHCAMGTIVEPRSRKHRFRSSCRCTRVVGVAMGNRGGCGGTQGDGLKRMAW